MLRRWVTWPKVWVLRLLYPEWEIVGAGPGWWRLWRPPVVRHVPAERLWRELRMVHRMFKQGAIKDGESRTPPSEGTASHARQDNEG